MIKMRRILTVLIASITLLSAYAALNTVYASNSAAPSGAPRIGNCPVFPGDNPWNRDISHDPIDPNSWNYVTTLNTGGRALGFAFGNYPEFGIPYNIVPGYQAKVNVKFTQHASQSDPGPYPIPHNPLIEGMNKVYSDQHLIMVDADNCLLYELYKASLTRSGWTAYSGAIFDLRSNVMRPEGWTSADAAGLPIFPGLIRYDEVASGAIKHAIRVSIRAYRSQANFVYPARHFQGSNTKWSAPPMGTRLRLKANYDISKFTGQARVILEALKKYGMIVADEGKNSWTLWGTSSPYWDRPNLETLRQIPGSAFEAVDPNYSPSVIKQASDVQLKVQYKPGDTNAVNNKIRPVLAIVNPSNGYGVLQDLKLRYWFSSEGAKSFRVSCLYAAIGCQNINLTIVKAKTPNALADYCVEITFDKTAGAIFPHNTSGVIQLQVYRSNFQNFNEYNDYSFSTGPKNLTDWSKVTLYRKNLLIWGTEPNGSTLQPTRAPSKPTNAPQPKPATPTNVPVPTSVPVFSSGASVNLQYKVVDIDSNNKVIAAAINLINNSKTPIPYGELKVRYWFTRDSGAAPIFNCNRAVLNCSYVYGKAVSVPSRNGADYYVEIGISSKKGLLYPGGQTGSIEFSITRSDHGNLNESNDYSFDASKTQFSYWPRITVYRNSALIWGKEPSGGASTQPLFQPPTNTPHP